MNLFSTTGMHIIKFKLYLTKLHILLIHGIVIFNKIKIVCNFAKDKYEYKKGKYQT